MFQGRPHRSGPRSQALVAAALLGLGGSLPAADKAPQTIQAAPKSFVDTTRAPRYLAGFPMPFPQPTDYRPRMGSVVAADVDADGRSDLVVSVPSGQILLLRPNGTPFPGWPRRFDNLPQPAFPVGDPAVGDLDGDGSPEIVTCVVSGTPMRRNLLYAIHLDGTDLERWPIEMTNPGYDYYSCSNIPTVLADLNADGHPEVIRGMNKGTIQAFDRTGRSLPNWPLRLAMQQGHSREVNADLAVGDLDGDGRKDLIFVESALEPRLAAVSYDGRFLPGFPMGLFEIVDRQGPAVADLDGDGLPEVVQATLPYDGNVIEPAPDPSVGPARPAELHVMHANGSIALGWPRPLQSGASWGAVLADLDEDGLPEILQQDGLDLLGFGPTGDPLPDFPIKVHHVFRRAQSVDLSPWVVGDLNGDERLDLLQVTTYLAAGTSFVRVFGVRGSGKMVRGFPFDAAGALASRPVLADFSGDGLNDLVLLLAADSNGGWILAGWELGGQPKLLR